MLGKSINSATIDAIWAVSSMEIYAKLTRQPAWTDSQWQDWLVNTIQQLVSAEKST